MTEKKYNNLIKTTGKQTTIQLSKHIAKTQGINKHDYCKNIERKFGKEEAKKEYKKWRS